MSPNPETLAASHDAPPATPAAPAIVDAVEDSIPGIAVRREGKGRGRWVLLDFGDFVVHVQHTEERAFYDLERLWKDCPAIELPDA